MHTLSDLRSGRLAGIRRLDLSCGLTEFPREILTLADSLEVLNLSGNALHALPDDLHRLHRLQVLFASDNQFTELPAAVGRCKQLRIVGFKANRIVQVPADALPPKLRWLILTDNALAELPRELGRCADLQKLMLAGNQLRELPAGLANCRRLELLRIAANRFDTLPRWLFDLPQLSWLAFGGNPITEAMESKVLSAHRIPAIDWPTLALTKVLGEGASGVIHQAEGPQGPVAVKLFKGEVTSDGLPRSEMAACIAAQAHPNLIEVIGVIGEGAHHPQGASGLVMRLIDPAFTNLAGPPSLDSCTRDVYAPQTRFTGDVALSMARGLADAARHLHSRGITHGDLYAHNTLWNGRGEALLGDFGAASFVPSDDPDLAIAMERIEVRAFGCLLEELLARCDDGVPDAMHTLRDQCLNDDPFARPLFADVVDALGVL
jgi:hypothetical protein